MVTFLESAPITTASSVTACPGTNISVPVIVDSFNTIGAISLTLNYDPTVLSYISGENTSGFPGLVFNQLADGSILVAGFTSLPEGVTYANNTTLITLNFNYLGGTSDLSWIDDGSSCDYQGPYSANYPTLNDSPQSTYYIDGQVSGYPTPTLVSATVTDALCFGGNGIINIEYTDGTGTLNYTIGAETNTTGTFTRPAGTYTYSVSDANGCPPVTGTVTITQPTDISASASVTTTIACFGSTATATLS
ncbi:MAG: cohesin domain-containing protein, partial [Lentimicrobium sp.]